MKNLGNFIRISLYSAIVAAILFSGIFFFITRGGIVGDWEFIGISGMTEEELATQITLDGSELGMVFESGGTGYFIEAGSQMPMTWETVGSDLYIDDGWHPPQPREFSLSGDRLTIDFGVLGGYVFSRITAPVPVFMWHIGIIGLLLVYLIRVQIAPKLPPNAAAIVGAICVILPMIYTAILVQAAASTADFAVALSAFAIGIIITWRFAATVSTEKR